MKLSEYSKLCYGKKDEQLREKYCKACYDIYIKFCSNPKVFQQVALEEGLSTYTIRIHANEYAKKVLGISSKELSKKLKKIAVADKIVIKNFNYNEVLEELLQENSEEKIIEIIKQYKIKGINIKEKVSDFAFFYHPDKVMETIEILNDKIDIFINYTKEQQILLETKIRMIEEFVKDDTITKEKYCELNQITIEDFDSIVEYCQINDLMLFEKYIDKIEKLQNQILDDLILKIKQMINYLENGIECENGNSRTFDLIDYYELIGLDFDAFINICLSEKCNLNSKELGVVKNFVKLQRNNTKSSSIARKSFFDSIKEYNCKKDKYGKLMIGSGKRLTTEEKEEITEMFKILNIPENDTTYTLASRRYVNGTLKLIKTKKYPT